MLIMNKALEISQMSVIVDPTLAAYMYSVDSRHSHTAQWYHLSRSAYRIICICLIVVNL